MDGGGESRKTSSAPCSSTCRILWLGVMVRKVGGISRRSPAIKSTLYTEVKVCKSFEHSTRLEASQPNNLSASSAMMRAASAEVVAELSRKPSLEKAELRFSARLRSVMSSTVPSKRTGFPSSSRIVSACSVTVLISPLGSTMR